MNHKCLDDIFLRRKSSPLIRRMGRSLRASYTCFPECVSSQRARIGYETAGGMFLFQPLLHSDGRRDGRSEGKGETSKGGRVAPRARRERADRFHTKRTRYFIMRAGY